MFAERMGDTVAHSSITLVDDPTNPAAFTATAIDGEGLATRRTPLIDNGVLTGFLHNCVLRPPRSCDVDGLSSSLRLQERAGCRCTGARSGSR
jgi:hypothetical protein